MGVTWVVTHCRTGCARLGRRVRRSALPAEAASRPALRCVAVAPPRLRRQPARPSSSVTLSSISAERSAPLLVWASSDS
eukprot:scaffold29575_cov72-Phaeocystis_antarctica.AAC.3